jgi:hypothetical protein
MRTVWRTTWLHRSVRECILGAVRARHNEIICERVYADHANAVGPGLEAPPAEAEKPSKTELFRVAATAADTPNTLAPGLETTTVKSKMSSLAAGPGPRGALYAEGVAVVGAAVLLVALKAGSKPLEDARGTTAKERPTAGQADSQAHNDAESERHCVRHEYEPDLAMRCAGRHLYSTTWPKSSSTIMSCVSKPAPSSASLINACSFAAVGSARGVAALQP